MGKCRFFDVCKCADQDSPTCAKTEGEYYGPGRMAGCGRDLSAKGERSSYHKNYIESKEEREIREENEMRDLKLNKKKKNIRKKNIKKKKIKNELSEYKL